MKRTIEQIYASTVDLSVYVVEFAPMNEEERHVKVLKSVMKTGNHQYKCRYCNHKFHGGASKIKAHLCGGVWRSVRVAPCVATKPSQTEQWILELKQERTKAKDSANQLWGVPPPQNDNRLLQRNAKNQH